MEDKALPQLPTDPGFYNWLRERAESEKQIEQRIQLEIPVTPRLPVEEQHEDDSRGVVIIDLY